MKKIPAIEGEPGMRRNIDAILRLEKSLPVVAGNGGLRVETRTAAGLRALVVLNSPAAKQS